MADNYLEKKMEELRRGKPSAAPRARTAPGQALMRLGFKRALIVGGRYLDFARLLLRHGVRTALATDADIPADSGLRLCPLADGPEFFDRLLADWHGLDLLLVDAESPLLSSLIDRWHRHRTDWPHVSDYGGRLILPFTDGRTGRASLQAAECLSGTDITATAIPAEQADTPTLLWLSLPQAKIISQQMLKYVK